MHAITQQYDITYKKIGTKEILSFIGIIIYKETHKVHILLLKL